MHKSLFAALVLAASVTGSAFAQAPATNPAAGTTTKPAVTAPVATTPAKPATLIDINSASLTDLQTLKGVGAARAEAIVKGRPFKGKDELLEKKIVPANVYNDIKDQIIARHKN